MRRGACAIAIAMWASLGLVTGACTGEPAPHPSRTPEPGATGGWVTKVDEAAGFTVSYPASWHLARTSLTPTLTSPLEIFSVGTYRLRPGGLCAQFPSRAIDDLGPRDALVSVQESSPVAGIRPISFRPTLFGPTDGKGRDESPGCIRTPKEFTHRWIPFESDGRAFYAYVAMGIDVSRSTRRSAWGVLDSLVFERGPAAPTTPRCGVIDVGSMAYGTVMLPTHAAPGDEVMLSGSTYRGEDGRYYPAERLEVWFNTKVPATQVPDAGPITPGPIVPLATVRDMARCTLSTHFTVPDVPPGSYTISVFVFDRSGYGFWLPHTLIVT
jgi:hypothetical protein